MHRASSVQRSTTCICANVSFKLRLRSHANIPAEPIQPPLPDFLRRAINADARAMQRCREPKNRRATISIYIRPQRSYGLYTQPASDRKSFPSNEWIHDAAPIGENHAYAMTPHCEPERGQTLHQVRNKCSRQDSSKLNPK